MVYIISRKGKQFKESHITSGGIEKCERDGISRSAMMQQIVQMTDSLSADARRDIVTDFVDREKGK